MPRGLAAPSAGDLAFLFLLSAIWGSSFLFIKVAVVHIPPVSLTALRLVVAGIILCAYGFFRGQRMPAQARAWRPYLVIALFGNAFPFTLVGIGELEIDSGQAAILLGAMPIFTLLLAHYFTHDEPITPRRALGIMVGLGGILVLVIPTTTPGAQFSGGMLFKLAVVMAALSYAIATVYGRRLAHVSPLLITTASTLVAAVIMVPASLILDKQWLGALVAGTTAMPGMAALASAAMLGVLCTAAAGIIFFHLLGRTGATFTSQINYLIPAFGVLWGFLFLSESLSWNLAAALGLIISGIALTRSRGRET
ncbi:MAG: EamA family transporter [Alphaproteobacteria bacterium]|nr:EamA family transporter [Alphaproteobacteria bacterium]